MRFTLMLSQGEHRHFQAIARAAEESGWASITIQDSLFFSGAKLTDQVGTAMRKQILTMRLLAGLWIGVLCIALVASPILAADAIISPIGVWATQGGGSHVKIADCGGKLCGAIIWLKEPLNKEGKDKVDSKNPDPSLRTRKLAGLALLSGFVQDQSDPNAWTGGEIYNPGDGKTYSCNLTLQDADTLRVRGYVGFSILGKTQVWTRVK